MQVRGHWRRLNPPATWTSTYTVTDIALQYYPRREDLVDYAKKRCIQAFIDSARAPQEWMRDPLFWAHIRWEIVKD